MVDPQEQGWKALVWSSAELYTCRLELGRKGKLPQCNRKMDITVTDRQTNKMKTSVKQLCRCHGAGLTKLPLVAANDSMAPILPRARKGRVSFHFFFSIQGTNFKTVLVSTCYWLLWNTFSCDSNEVSISFGSFLK